MDKEVKQFNPFEKLYKRNLNESEIREMEQNLVGFFKLLFEIDLEHKKNVNVCSISVVKAYVLFLYAQFIFK